MTSVLLLGSSGMLGSMVRHHLAASGRFSVRALCRPEFDAERLLAGAGIAELSGTDFVINCIGIIKPYCKDDSPEGVERAIRINACFPHLLAHRARSAGTRVIQIATDCVYSGAKGRYVETDPHDALDVYGKTKSLGELHGAGVLNVRCSIVGPEIGRQSSLLEWLLSQPPGAALNGFSHHRWNGVTTLQFARLCAAIMAEKGAFERLAGRGHTHHFTPNETVGKDELLRLMAGAYGRSLDVRSVNDVGPPVDRTLATRFTDLSTLYPSESLGAALGELAAVDGAFRRSRIGVAA